MKTAFSGPLVTYGDRNPLGTAATASVNPDKAPNVFWGGSAIMDPRVGYNLYRSGTIGWLGNNVVCVIDQVPFTIGGTSNNNIAASQTPVAGTALTLVSSSGQGVTVMSAATTFWSSGTSIAANTLALDNVPGIVTFGMASISSGFTAVSVYDPTKALSRNVRIVSAGNDTSAVFTVAGYDLYGNAMSEAVTGANGTASGAKAFKFITSVTPSGTLSGSAVTVGTGDVYGFPLVAGSFGTVEVFWNSSWVSANTGFVAAVTSAATTTTGDTRGTYALQAASNNTLRLTVNQLVTPAMLASTAALVGVTQA